jgi:hypothetical protein
VLVVVPLLQPTHARELSPMTPIVITARQAGVRRALFAIFMV